MKKPRRVTITYSADLTEVPSRIALYFKELSEKLENLATFCKSFSDGMEGSESPINRLIQIEMCQEALDRHHIRMGDCHTIYKGYLAMLTQMAEEQEMAKEVEEAPLPKKKPKKTSKKKKEK